MTELPPACLDTARVSGSRCIPCAVGWIAGARGGVHRGLRRFWRQQLQIEPTILISPRHRVSGDQPGGSRHRRSERSTMQQESRACSSRISSATEIAEHVIPEFVGIFLKRVSQMLRRASMRRAV